VPKSALHWIFACLAGLLLLVAGCKGDDGDACFENDHCRGSLICCGATGTTRGTCETSCEDVPRPDAGAAAGNDAGDAGDDAGEDDAGEDDAGEDDAGEDDAGEDDAGEDDAGEDAGEDDDGDAGE